VEQGGACQAVGVLAVGDAQRFVTAHPPTFVRLDKKVSPARREQESRRIGVFLGDSEA
jgi:hypothetical protein